MSTPKQLWGKDLYFFFTRLHLFHKLLCRLFAYYFDYLHVKKYDHFIKYGALLYLNYPTACKVLTIFSTLTKLKMLIPG